MIDVSTPTAPVLINSITTPSSAMDLALAGNYVYIAERGIGLQVVAKAIASTTTWFSATSLEVIAPTHLPLGTYDVTVLNPDNTNSKGQNAIVLTDADVTTDSDGDGVPDSFDNCIDHENSDQRDTNGDMFGNRCDPDLNNDLFTNSLDLGIMSTVFFTSDQDADLNGDGFVNSQDLGIMGTLFFQPPGPSAFAP